MYLYTVSTQFPALFGMSIHHEYIIIISFFRVVFMQKGDVHEILTSYLLLFQLPGFADDDFWFRKIFTLVNPPFKDPQGIYQDFCGSKVGKQGQLVGCAPAQLLEEPTLCASLDGEAHVIFLDKRGHRSRFLTQAGH